MLLRKGFFVVVFLALTVSAVNAYTVIMRDGRRVEIPNEFTVTDSMLTYEVGNGIQITIQLNTVNIAATERANNEAKSSFLSKANAPKAQVQPATQTNRATAERSITNADLEKYRRARIANENQRKRLGLPSPEERQREVAAIDARTAEQVRSMRAQEEAYWRTRADALRAGMAANEAQVEFLRQRREELPFSYGYPTYLPFETVGYGIAAGSFAGSRRFQSSPFSSFLSTPITPFPTFQSTRAFRGHGRPLVFGTPRGRIHSRPSPVNHGRRR